mmetsp:Transcript_98997/g.279683  ORF Transcript_98997/g.279683 Transcript_98997/m.279683 type:complete len:318 (+) Transcript_98997:551-1504(+)
MQLCGVAPRSRLLTNKLPGAKQCCVASVPIAFLISHALGNPEHEQCCVRFRKAVPLCEESQCLSTIAPCGGEVVEVPLGLREARVQPLGARRTIRPSRKHFLARGKKVQGLDKITMVRLVHRARTLNDQRGVRIGGDMFRLRILLPSQAIGLRSTEEAPVPSPGPRGVTLPTLRPRGVLAQDLRSCAPSQGGAPVTISEAAVRHAVAALDAEQRQLLSGFLAEPLENLTRQRVQNGIGTWPRAQVSGLGRPRLEIELAKYLRQGLVETPFQPQSPNQRQRGLRSMCGGNHRRRSGIHHERNTTRIMRAPSRQHRRMH